MLNIFLVYTQLSKKRINQNKSTFAAYIDFKKAFDFVNRDLLMYRLLLHRVNGKFYNSVKALYAKTSACVRLNNNFTNWFETGSGVRQGDCLSSTLFALFVNDLAVGLKDMKKGVKLNQLEVCLLMYADDIVLLAENEDDLQNMLNYVQIWCKKWRLVINKQKTKVMHFRKSRKQKSKFDFHLGDTELEMVCEYKYLGVLINEHLNYNSNADLLSKAAGRALGSVISKFKYMKDMGFQTYSTLFETCINPILNYGSEIWGVNDYQCCDRIETRALKFYLGLHRYASNVAVIGECGWINTKYHRWLNICRFWNRLVTTDKSRLVYKLFLYDKDLCKNNWSCDIKVIFKEICDEQPFDQCAT